MSGRYDNNDASDQRRRLQETFPAPPSNDDDQSEGGGGSGSPDSVMDGSYGLHNLEGTVVPRVEKIPWYRWIYMTVLVVIPTALYIMYFTAMGWGTTTFHYVALHYGEYMYLAAGATVAYFLLLYMLDANMWKHKILQGMCGAVLVGLIFITVLFLAPQYPFGPICCYAALTPLFLLWIIRMGRANGSGTMKSSTRHYVTSLSGPLFCVSMVTMVLFVVWTWTWGYAYNEETAAVYNYATGCVANLESYPQCEFGSVTQKDACPAPKGPTPSPSLQPTPFPSASTTTTTTTTTTPPATTMAPTAARRARELRHSEQERQQGGLLLLDHQHQQPQTRLLHGVFPNGSIAYHTEAPQVVYPSNYLFVATSMQQTLYNDPNVITQKESNLCFEMVVDPPTVNVPKYDANSTDPQGLTHKCDEQCPKWVYQECPNALILWAGPLMVSMVLFFLSFFCTFLRETNQGDAEKDIINFGKLWLFLLFTVWITVSLAGMGAGISTLLLAMTLASFIGACFFLGMTQSKQQSKEQAWELWSKFEEKCGGYMNVGRAIFVTFCAPILIVYFALSVVNQAVRKIGLVCSKRMKTAEERADFITKRARLQIQDMRSWERTKILTYGVYVGLTYMVMNVVITKFTYLLLTVLVEALKGLDLVVVTFILIAFGLIFFLNPALPGPPVYMTNGLVLFVVGHKKIGVAGALIYSIVLSVFVKLLACAMQQKMIGENLSKYVSVRKMVGINSSLIKASRLVLAQKGITIDKVSILVGGPDWPTSVLCGILHLDLIPILVGTLPVVFLCGPTSLMGSFMYMGDLKYDEKSPEVIAGTQEAGALVYPYAATGAAVATAVSALVMLAAPIMAAYYLEQAMTERAKEIEAIPNDDEVAELEREEEAFNECYEEASKWQVQPGFIKCTMYLAFAMMVMSVYIVLLSPKKCFAPYTLSSTIKKDLCGDWKNLVLPLGWVSIALFMISWVLIYITGSYINSQAKQLLESKPSSNSAPAEAAIEGP